MSDTPDRPSDLSCIFDEFLVRRQLGESPILDEYCQRFPDVAEQLRQHVRLYDAIGEAASEADIRGSMKDLHDPRVKQMLADLLSSGDTPEDVCRSCPELLPMVRAHWRQMCHVRAELDALFPSEANSDSGLSASGPGGAPLPSIPGYEVEAVLGVGGMGVVFKARHLQLNRVVALKMLIAGTYAGPPERARFQREAEAVAGLCHANIVQLYEVGEHEGRPYFAMELVDGGNLSQKLASKPQPVRRAAELVAQLAEAVSVAHSAGIIHRDLKPANILLTADGTPKITDFGLARRLEGEDRLTWTGTAIGTPSYMAPEQASGAGGPVGTAADVYGLGAVLYELLTGRPPFRGGTALETFRHVLAHEPVPPSQLNPQVPRDLETVCLKCLKKEPQQRYSSAAALADDLRRYLLGHVILARPVGHTEKVGKWIRRNKVVASLSAIAVLALLVGALASLVFAFKAGRQEEIATDKAGKLEKQAIELQEQTLAAMKNAQLAKENEEKVVQALAAERKARQHAFDALESITANVVKRKFAQGAVLTEDDRAFLRGIIAQLQAFAAITADDVDNRKMQAGGRMRVAVMRSHLGEAKEAEQDFDEAVSLYNRLAADFPSQPEFRQWVAKIQNDRGLLLRDMGRLKEAEQDYSQALSIQKQLATDFHSVAEFRQQLASFYINRGVLLSNTGRLKEAEQDYSQALSIQKQLATDFPSRPELRRAMASFYINRGVLLSNTGRLKEAEKDYGQALSIQKQLTNDFPSLPEFRQDLAKSHLDRGNLLHTVSRMAEAEKDCDEAVGIYKQLAAEFPSVPEYRQELANCLSNRGTLLRATGRLLKAEKDCDQAVSLCKQLAADFPSHPEFRHGLAASHINRGLLLSTMGRQPEAEKDYDQAVSFYKQLMAEFPSLPEFRQDLAKSYNNRGLLLRDTGRLPEAEKDYDQALNIKKKLAADFPSRPEVRRELATSHNNRGLLLQTMDRLQEAEKDYDQALNIQKQLVADFPNQPEFREDLARSYNNRGIVLDKTGRRQEAVKDYDQALSIQKQLADDSPNQPDRRNELAATCVNLAFLHLQLGNWATAKQLLLEGRPHHLAALKANPLHPTYRQFYRNHLNVLIAAHAGLLDQPEAVRTAETCRNLGWRASEDSYSAACGLCHSVTAVAKHDKLDAKEREAAAQFYSDAAMKALRVAVSKGYRDVTNIKTDTDLDPLRQREDFKKLVAELEGKGK